MIKAVVTLQDYSEEKVKELEKYGTNIYQTSLMPELIFIHVTEESYKTLQQLENVINIREQDTFHLVVHKEYSNRFK